MFGTKNVPREHDTGGLDIQEFPADFTCRMPSLILKLAKIDIVCNDVKVAWLAH